ncbi:MAG: family 1 glycosylhydrolase [Solirubrobacteraceae bacterium]
MSLTALCLIAYLACLASAVRASDPLAAISSSAPLGGINIGSGSSSAEADSDIAQARTLGAKVVRTEVSWTEAEPNGAGQVNSGALVFLDRLMSDASNSSIRVILLTLSTPCWASSAPQSLLAQCLSGKESQANAWPPSEPQAFAAFTAFLAQRYGQQLAAIEIWNEPDQANEDYLAGPDKAQHYAAMLRAAYPAIKQVNPGLPVLAGSLVGSNGAFLRELYAAGIKGYYDGLAVHFYNLTLGSLRAIHETQLANGDSTPLWLDEFGWSSCYPRHKTQQEQACVTTQIQAQNIANTYRALAHTPYIAAVVPYALHSSSSEDFGVLTTGGARKPSFKALAGVLASPFGRVSPVTLKLSSRGGKIIASGSGPVGDYMRLEAFTGRVLRYKALFILNRFNRYSISLPRALGTHGVKVRVFQYWAGAARGAQRSI